MGTDGKERMKEMSTQKTGKKENEDREQGKGMGLAIARRRRELNMTQEELAEKSEISRQSVCNIEQGKQKPSGRTLIEISKALGIQVEDLEGGGEGKRKQQRMENERLIEEGKVLPMSRTILIKQGEAEDKVKCSLCQGQF